VNFILDFIAFSFFVSLLQFQILRLWLALAALRYPYRRYFKVPGAVTAHMGSDIFNFLRWRRSGTEVEKKMEYELAKSSENDRIFFNCPYFDLYTWGLACF
jgi:hypothetical protein